MHPADRLDSSLFSHLIYNVIYNIINCEIPFLRRIKNVKLFNLIKMSLFVHCVV